MADEITKTIRITATKNGATVSYVAAQSRQDMAGNILFSTIQSIGTSSETVSFGEISGAPGKVIIKNLDSANFVELGGDSGLTVFKLKLLAGDELIIPPSSATLYAKADTAAVRIQVMATEL